MKPARTVSCLISAALILAAGGCGTDASNGGEGAANTSADTDRVEPAEEAPVDETVAGIRSFTGAFGELLAERGAGETENTVFSPLSLGYAFAMLRAGADGVTADQLDEVFGFPQGVHAAYNALSTGVVNTGEAADQTGPDATREPDEQPPDPVVSIANGLFVQDGIEPGEDFLNTLARQYGAGAEYVDFSTGSAAEKINDWVSDRTNERIDTLFDELDPRTVTVLANAVYLKAGWESPFDESRTTDEPFHLADGTTTEVPMMNKEAAELSYVDGDSWEAVQLPYVGGELAMWVVVPAGEPGQAPTVTAGMLEEFDHGEPTELDIALPRWDYGADAELLPLLAELGLRDLDDLGGIAEEVVVDDAVHRANITVDESGTEAAAVTGIAGVVSAPLPADKTIRADQPFSYAITHEPTGAPLFVGSVADPG
ncbi:serpin family protein [Haloechinothrix sp. YIM 98757]|uniref:Serpin family protein n=1 Tax=Haloechinothrix aidingensis TaxID=2752311 RepID=A0A838AG65_9PSEU|nr:serpin family protein [Haloechinothrix aidingensis]MBA0128170.1 serpin family protein [Haloechinothrix aidingensis]